MPGYDHWDNPDRRTIMASEKVELFSKKFTKGSRTYYFDVKEASNGNKYLVITESKKAGEGFERSRVMVFEDQLPEFVDTFNEAVAAAGKK